MNSATQLTAFSPIGTLGTVNVTLTNGTTESEINSVTKFTYIQPSPSPPPSPPEIPGAVVLAVSPNVGPTTGGTTVLIDGNNLTSVSKVLFGDSGAGVITSVSSRRVSVISPPGTPGTVNLTLQMANTVHYADPAHTFTYTPKCGQGISLPTGTHALWQQLALPCVPFSPSLLDVFGTGTASNLTNSQYGKLNPPSDGWMIERWDTSTSSQSYAIQLPSDPLNIWTGYFIKSYESPSSGMLAISDAAASLTPSPVSQYEGCASPSGCIAIPIPQISESLRKKDYLLPNPYPFNVDWSKVRIRVDHAPSTFTPAQAANEAPSGNLIPPVMSDAIWVWNGTSYETASSQPPTRGNLQYFKSFWVEALPDAQGHSLELLIPNEPSIIPEWSGKSKAPNAPPPPTVRPHKNPQKLPNKSDWYVRLKIEDPSNGWGHRSTFLGELENSSQGYDMSDLVKKAPFTEPYLYLTFPHPYWGDHSGEYSSDFRPISKQPEEWAFEIHSSVTGGTVFLGWEGKTAIFKKSKLVDLQTGKTIHPADGKWKKRGYRITINSEIQKYVWRYQAR